MTKHLVTFVAFNALLFASLLVAQLIVGWYFWQDGMNIVAAFIFLFAETFIIAGTIGPALMRWMADKEG